MSTKYSDKDSVRSFLQDVKDTITLVTPISTLTYVARPKNTACLTLLGYTLTDLKETILELSTNDYIRGPFEDAKERGLLWEFGKHIKEIDVYIKLKLADFSSVKIVRIISFHVAEFPLTYKFRIIE